MANNRAQILITAVNQTQAAFNAVKGGLSGLASAAQSVNGVLGNLGLAVTAAGMVALVKSSIDAGDELSKMSQRVGISVATLSLWNPLAKQAGVSGESFEKGLRKLSTTMLEGATGSEDAARNFTAVGVAFKNQDGTLRGTDQVFLDLAERFKAMPDGAQKSAGVKSCAQST